MVGRKKRIAARRWRLSLCPLGAAGRFSQPRLLGSNLYGSHPVLVR
ncbi:MAG: hypothetical protein ACRBB4_11875 [Neptuniibacter sp.]